jgi:BON domain-containing protein
MIQLASLMRPEREPTHASNSDHLVRQIEGRLRASPYLSLRRVSCLRRQGRLVLRGRVPTYYVKQLAQSIVRSICPEREIVDQIEVVAAVRTIGDLNRWGYVPALPR